MPSNIVPLGLDELDYDIDLDAINDIPLVAEGTYDALVVKMEPYISQKNTNNVYWHCRVLDDTYAGAPPVRGSTLLPTKEEPKKAWAYARSMKNIGVSSKEFPRIPDQLEAAVGRYCQITVTHFKTEKGNIFAQVGTILPPRAGVQTAASVKSGDELF